MESDAIFPVASELRRASIAGFVAHVRLDANVQPTVGNYFDVYGHQTTAKITKSKKQPSDKAPESSKGVKIPKERLRAARQASVRHSRAPSDAGSPPVSFLDDKFALHPSFTSEPITGEAFVESLPPRSPRSPGGRKSRSRYRAGNGITTRQRNAEMDLDLQAKELKARLELLSACAGSSAPSSAEFKSGETSLSISPESSSLASPNEARSRRLSTNGPLSIKTDDLRQTRTSHSNSPVISRPSLAAAAEKIPRIPSIDELVTAHMDQLSKASHALPAVPVTRPSYSSRVSAPPKVETHSIVEDNEENSPRSSLDSIAAEAARALYITPPTSDRHRPHSDALGIHSVNANGETARRKVSKGPAVAPSPQENKDRQIAAYLKSPRLTKIFVVDSTLINKKKIAVSVSDVGDQDGHPIFIYLGLGCVRYLAALYDEFAESLGLRLICLDRWGLGRTEDIPEKKRGFLEWSAIVEQVANQLSIKKFSILAHSAGAPYALATSVRLADRIQGSIHLLAPFVDATVQGQSTAYKFLKLMPRNILTTAQTAEWKLQAWKLGKPPELIQLPVGNDPKGPVSYKDYTDEVQPPRLVVSTSVDDLLSSDQDDSDARSNFSSATEGKKTPTRMRTITSLSLDSPPALKRPSLGRKTSQPFSKDEASRVSSLHSSTSTIPKFTTPANHSPSLSIKALETEESTPSPADIATALLQASHAESLKGSTSDLMVILERTGKSSGFRYSDIVMPCKVWFGDKDDRISLTSINAFVQAIPNCTLTVIKGADHNLTTNASVMFEVLESIKQESTPL